MKKILLIFIALFGLINTQDVSAGCGGVFLHTNYLNYASAHYYDSIVQCPGTQNKIYATFESCCASLFSPTIPIVWFCNGVPIDTTQLYVVHGNWYTHMLTITQPGIYKATFLGFGIVSTNSSCITAYCPFTISQLPEVKNVKVPQVLNFKNVFMDDAGQLRISLGSDNDGSVELQLITLGGTTLHTQTMEVLTGTNEFAVSLPEHPEGFFILSACINADCTRKKVFLHK